jgi:hypothetical protein
MPQRRQVGHRNDDEKPVASGAINQISRRNERGAGMVRLKHGGKRNGAGRKPSPDVAKVPYGTKLEAEVVEYLRQCENAAKTLEDVIKRTKAFKEWKAKYDMV